MTKRQRIVAFLAMQGGKNESLSWKEIAEKFHLETDPKTLKTLSDWWRYYKKTGFLSPDMEIEDISKVDMDMALNTVRLAKQKQRYQDINRIERKSFREHARIENAVEVYNKELIELLKKESLDIKTVKHRDTKEDNSLLLQISDLHLNELIYSKYNIYDFDIASKRLMKLANKVIFYGRAVGTKDLTIAFLGDLLNSDRRMDELLASATNRAKATQLSIRLLSMFINYLNQCFNIKCYGVTGNEARAKKELGWTDFFATDNYDFTIFDTLSMLYENKEGVYFDMMQANECLIKVKDTSFLLIHGHSLSQSGMQKQIQEIIGKFTALGISVNHVLLGHIHSAYISDYFSRNASLSGGNAYSDEGLNFMSKASQNLHIVSSSGNIDSIKIDLQNVNNQEGFPIKEYIDMYDAKSIIEANKGSIIFMK